MPISHLLLFPLLRLTDPYLRGEMDNTPLTGRGSPDCMEELAFGWHGSQPGRIGQIELKHRWDISEDEAEERRRPGIDALSLPFLRDLLAGHHLI